MLTPEPVLADRLEAMKQALGLRVIEEMYATNPFWEERFGKRGRRHADQDAGYHLSYLGSALRIGSPSVMTEYARWLRGVLVSRGMCTRHLTENFARMRDAIVAAKIESADPAISLLAASEQALVYADGAASRVDAVASPVAGAVATQLLASQPEWAEQWGDCAHERLDDDLRHHLSYLADALHSGRPELFTAHADFTAASLAKRGLPASRPSATLDALGAALAAALANDPPARDACARLLDTARAQLAKTGDAARSGGGDDRMIVVTSRIRIVSGNADDVARLYRDRLQLADGAPSCRGVEILRNLEVPEEFVVYTRWDDRASYEAYRKSEAFKTSHQRLREISGVVKIDHATRMVDTFEVLS